MLASEMMETVARAHTYTHTHTCSTDTCSKHTHHFGLDERDDETEHYANAKEGLKLIRVVQALCFPHYLLHECFAFPQLQLDQCAPPAIEQVFHPDLSIVLALVYTPSLC